MSVSKNQSQFQIHSALGPYNNYLDKMRGGGKDVKKMSVFVHAQGIKTVLAGGRG